MIKVLTSIISIFGAFGGPNSKMAAGGLGGVVAAVGGDVILGQFRDGLITGTGDSFEKLGMALGLTIGGWITGAVITWLGKANNS